MSSGTMLATVTAEEKETTGGLCPCAAEHSLVSTWVQEPAVTLSSAVRLQIICGVVGGRSQGSAAFWPDRDWLGSGWDGMPRRGMQSWWV